MLNRLITAAVAIGIVYFLLTQAMPWLRDQFTSNSTTFGSPIDSEDGRCVDAAGQANDRLTSTARNYGQPPVDVEGWSNAVWEIESDIQNARSSCTCMSDACAAANQALEEMSSLLSNLDGMVRGTSPGFANPGNQQERIQGFLRQARSSAGY